MWPALNCLQSPAVQNLCSAVPDETTQEHRIQTFLDPLSQHPNLVQASLERSLEEIFKTFLKSEISCKEELTSLT